MILQKQKFRKVTPSMFNKSLKTEMPTQVFFNKQQALYHSLKVIAYLKSPFCLFLFNHFHRYNYRYIFSDNFFNKLAELGLFINDYVL